MTQWAVRGSSRRVLGLGCDAMRCEMQFKGFCRADVTQWAVRGSLRRVLAGGFDAMGGERQFKECFGGKM